MKSYLIIGNGVAGASAAEKIKKVDPRGRVTILSQERDAFYYRPRLPELMAGEVDIERITLRSAAWYRTQGLDLRLGERAVAVDAQARMVTTASGQGLPYDELLLATGAHSFLPPLPGTDLPGVFALRSADDARAINKGARRTQAAILLGGGLLGLEAGAALARLGLKVQVVEVAPRLLPRQMDAAGAALLQRRLEGLGFSFLLGAQARAISGQAGALTLELADGRRLEGGLVLFSAGIRGNLELAGQLGLEVKQGLVVDDRMHTNQPGIWAAGDQVEHRGRLYGIWPASKAQGEVAGMNMAGGHALYQGTVLSNTLKVVGVDLTAAGDIDPEGALPAAVFNDGQAYRKIVLDEGRIKGFIFFGLTQGVKECQQALEQGRPVGELAGEMEGRDFDFGRLLA